MELELFLFVPSDHPSKLLLSINKKRLPQNLLHLTMHRNAQPTQPHLPNIPGLTSRLPGTLTRLNSRIQTTLIIDHKGLVMLPSKFADVLYDVAAAIWADCLV